MMQIELTLAVRNPEWYWSPKEQKESDGYYDQWKVFNEDKIEKHLPEYKYLLDVEEIRDDRNGSYPLCFIHPGTKIKTNVTVEDVTIVRFIRDKQSSDLVISNSIIHQYLGAQKRGKNITLISTLKKISNIACCMNLFGSADQHMQKFPER